MVEKGTSGLQGSHPGDPTRGRITQSGGPQSAAIEECLLVIALDLDRMVGDRLVQLGQGGDPLLCELVLMPSPEDHHPCSGGALGGS